MKLFYRIYASYTMHIWDESYGDTVETEGIHTDFSKIFPLGLCPKPPPKGKKVKNQNLRSPQKAKAQVEVPVAGRAPVAMR
jgi:hypothetical protein